MEGSFDVVRGRRRAAAAAAAAGGRLQDQRELTVKGGRRGAQSELVQLLRLSGQG